MAATPNCQIVESAVLAAFPDARFGRFNCRHIGSNPMRSWSQHAGSEPARRYFANALDIWHVDHKLAGKPADSSPAHQTWLRAVRAFITLNYGVLIDQMLGPGDNRAHANHIHISTFPKMKSNWWYRPPCKGGSLIVIYEDGTTGDTFGDPPSPIMEDAMWPLKLNDGKPGSRAYKFDDVMFLQKRLRRLGQSLKTDGFCGPVTIAAASNVSGLTLTDEVTGEAGERIGSVSIAVLAPEGSQGEQGEQGDPGPQGVEGIAGPEGMTGAPGPEGPAPVAGKITDLVYE